VAMGDEASAQLSGRELDFDLHGVAAERCVVPPADLRRVPHECGDLEWADTRLRELAAESVPVVKAVPDEPGPLLSRPQVG